MVRPPEPPEDEAGRYERLPEGRLLVDGGAEIDVVVGVTPFLAAWLWRKFNAAKFLALHGADVNFKDRKGRNALQFARERKYDPKLIQWLVKHGASVTLHRRA